MPTTAAEKPKKIKVFFISLIAILLNLSFVPYSLRSGMAIDKGVRLVAGR